LSCHTKWILRIIVSSSAQKITYFWKAYKNRELLRKYRYNFISFSFQKSFVVKILNYREFSANDDKYSSRIHIFQVDVSGEKYLKRLLKSFCYFELCHLFRGMDSIWKLSILFKIEKIINRSRSEYWKSISSYNNQIMSVYFTIKKSVNVLIKSLIRHSITSSNQIAKLFEFICHKKYSQLNTT